LNGGSGRLLAEQFLEQQLARHASPITTIIYTHPGGQDLWEGMSRVPW